MPATTYSLARKESTGWKHILKIKWNGTLTDWHERVTEWGQVLRKISTFEDAYSGGADHLSISDTDQTMWGSFKGANGTQALWSLVELESYLGGLQGTFAYPGQGSDAKFGLFRFGDIRFGDVLLTSIINRGRITQLEAQGNIIRLPMFDDMTLLNNAKFVWDYTWIGSSAWHLHAFGTNDRFGTIESVLNATTITVEESAFEELHGTLNTRFTKQKFADYRNWWNRSESYGGVASNAILPGDKIKFSNTLLDDPDAGSVLQLNPSFQISEGAIFVDTTRNATFATISFTRNLYDASPGMRLYKQIPLKYEGNPAEVVRQMIIGSNTNIGLPSGSISSPYYRAATSVCSPVHVVNWIENDGQGAVVGKIKELSEIFDAQFFFDRNGQWVWNPYRPLLRDTIDQVSDSYDGGTLGTNTVATNNIMPDPRYTEQARTVFTDFIMDFDYDPREEDQDLQYRGHEQLFRSDVSSAYNGYRNYKRITTKWISNRNDAIVLGNRFLRSHATAALEYDFDTSLYGLEEELLSLVYVSHRTGSLNQRTFSIDSMLMALDEDRISLRMKDVTPAHFKSGYGYLMSGSNLEAEVSATSTFGWCWPDTVGDGKHGTVFSNIGSLEVTAVLYDTLGNQPTTIGIDGITHFITMGSEIMKVTSTAALATKTLLRNQETTKHGSYTAGHGWCSWPMDTNGDIITMYNGTNIAGTSMRGTVLNISVGSYGTVWRWF